MKAHLGKHRHARVCAAARPGRASCNAIVDRDVSGGVTAGSLPAGYGPSDLQSAYRLPASAAGSGQAVAVVDAFDLPSAESDLAAYRSKFGLPACTSASGCFRKVNQRGGSSLPAANSSWGQEIDLDLDMVSAACPNCSILLVESDDDNNSNMGAAVATAAGLGVAAISNSYGGPETSDEGTSDSRYYNHPGIAVTASAGDSGYGVQYPASSPYVTAVGGTSLTEDSTSRGFSETAWNGTGSGCSAYEPKPSWQHDGGCGNRTVADVSADSDPATGVAVYDSTPINGQSGWLVFGGTSAAAPLVASAYVLAGRPVTGSYPVAGAYSSSASLFDVTSGSNGSCRPTYLCTATSGYDGPTGLGTPNGVAAFTPASASTTAPGAPTGVTATVGNASATVSWTAPGNNGGSPVTGYVVTPYAAGVAQAAQTFASTATSQPVSGLTNGTSYTFTVAATNAVGTGPASSPSAAVTPRVPASTVSISGASTRAATYGSAVTVAGTATPGSSVGLWFHGAGTTGYTQQRTLTAASNGTWSMSYVAGNDYRIYATSGTAQSPTILVQIAPTISGPATHIVPKGSTYTMTGTGIPGATLTVHFHKSGTATSDYSILRTVVVAGNGTWSRAYAATVDYRFYATLPNGLASQNVLVQAR
jgi:hypothetical protein